MEKHIEIGTFGMETFENLKKTKYLHKSLNGNSPSVLVSLDRISPDRIGKIISLYEHKVFTEGVIWNINSYDQWGVEEGKILAKKNLSKI